MNRLTVRTPSRLHFGLLSWGKDAPREFGGVGLMVDEPGSIIAAEPAAAWAADGPLRGRILDVAAHVVASLARQGTSAPPLRFAVLQAPPEHVGLGVGTQTGLAVARLIREFARADTVPAGELALLAGRGLRSGIGLHGFDLGGLIVDGGRAVRAGARPAPLIARHEFPPDWAVLVLIPPARTGLHGDSEVRAFGQIPPLPSAVVARLCRLVLLELLPAVAEVDLAAFGAALTEIQGLVGQGFASAQGGIYARPELLTLVENLRSVGLVGVGQSSWGPTLYGFTERSNPDRSAIVQRILGSTGWPPGSVFWTAASRQGASIRAD